MSSQRERTHQVREDGADLLTEIAFVLRMLAGNPQTLHLHRQKILIRIQTITSLGESFPFDHTSVRVVVPGSLDPDPDPDPAFQMNPDKDTDPDPIRIQGFDDQNFKKKIQLKYLSTQVKMVPNIDVFKTWLYCTHQYKPHKKLLPTNVPNPNILDRINILHVQAMTIFASINFKIIISQGDCVLLFSM
jgi:hypothetical protein